MRNKNFKYLSFIFTALHGMQRGKKKASSIRTNLRNTLAVVCAADESRVSTKKRNKKDRKKTVDQLMLRLSDISMSGGLITQRYTDTKNVT